MYYKKGEQGIPGQTGIFGEKGQKGEPGLEGLVGYMGEKVIKKYSIHSTISNCFVWINYRVIEEIKVFREGLVLKVILDQKAN